jgi:3-phosphoshikimate 1-carboxyvinyltransferase
MIKLYSPNKEIKGFISLPASKSLSNRLLIIRALSEEKFKIKNLSESKDTQVLIEALNNLDSQVIDIGATGTAMRFLTAFLSTVYGERILTGSERMKQRPIRALVNILRTLGAQIHYTEKEAYPPLKITGTNLKSKAISIPGNISSQYISALLMIAPYLDKGLKLTIEDKILSKDYIWMTIKLMQEFGAAAEWKQDVIHIEPGNYHGKEIIVESDWSSASYWFEIISLSGNSMVELTGLEKNSLQGDSVLTELYRTLGVDSVFTNFGVRIKNIPTTCTYFEYDFTDCPDLAQTLAVTLVAKQIPFKLNGLDNLSIKETDRIQALKNEFEKLGVHLYIKNNNTIWWDGNDEIKIPENHFVETYEDHRMALAFAPLALISNELILNDPKVISKSYPKYWDDLKSVGFKTSIT